MNHRASIVALASLSLLATACDRKATGQTVAVVNGEEITSSELNAEIAQANLPEGANKEAVRAQVLQNIINRRLLAQQAREQGVDKSPEYVARQRQMSEQLLLAMSSNRQGSTAKLPDRAAIDKFIADNPTAFGQRSLLSLQQIAFAPPRDPKVIEQLKSDHTLDELAATLTALKIPFKRGASKVDSAAIPPQVMAQINALPATEPFVVPANGQMVANVIVGREPVTVNPDESRKLAVQAMRNQDVAKSMEASLKQLKASAKIDYQPGFEPKPAATGAAAGRPART